MASDESVLRRLGPIELYSSSRHALGIYRAVTVSARYAPSSRAADAPVTAVSPRFLAALASVVRGHPMLRVGITGQDTNEARYAYLPSINLREHLDVETVHCASEAELNKEVARIQAQQHNKLWEDQEVKSPWRLTIVRDAQRDCEDVIFAFHHSLMDGTSGRKFHEFLLAALDEAADTDDSFLEFPSPPTLPEPQDDAVNFTLGPLYIASVLWNEFGPGMLKPAPQSIWAGVPVSFTLPYVTRIRPVDIPAAQTKVLLAACREHKTTMTGLLHALAFAYFAHTVPEDEAPGFSGTTPMGLHKYTKDDIDASLRGTLRVLISSMNHPFSLSDIHTMRVALSSGSDTLSKQIWSTAAQLRAALAARSQDLTHNNVTAMMKHVSDWRTFHTNRDGKPRPNTWECSNVGVLAPVGSGKKTEVSRVMFSNSAIVTGPALCMNVASAPGGQMNVALSWQEGVLEEEVVEGLGTALEGMIDKFCEQKMWQM